MFEHYLSFKSHFTKKNLYKLLYSFNISQRGKFLKVNKNSIIIHEAQAIESGFIILNE